MRAAMKTAVLAIPLVVAWWLPAPAVQAAAPTCVSSGPQLSFSNVDAGNSQTDATSQFVNFQCYNSDASVHWVSLCVGIDAGSGGGSNPRTMTSGTGQLTYQIYQDAARTRWWGNTFDATPNQAGKAIGVMIRLANVLTYPTINLYGRVPGGQSNVPSGSYADSPTASIRLVDHGDNPGATLTCSGAVVQTGSPGIGVNASVTNTCQITAGAGSNINLGSVVAGPTARSGSSTISVKCISGTPYRIGLAPSNGNTAGAGVMSGTGGNTQQVPYQLYQNSGFTTVWGNTATSSSTGNGVMGTGTGNAQGYTVWARAPGADYRPDTYSDTVTVNVHY